MAYDEELANRIRELVGTEPGLAEKRMRGKEMDGWLRIAPEGVKTKAQLERWVARGVAYARLLAPKQV